MSFDHLGLRVELLKVLKAKVYTVPTPIQAQAIPVIRPNQIVALLKKEKTIRGAVNARP